MKGRGSRFAALVMVGAVLAVAGGAFASIPDGGGVLHGCYNKINGLLRVIDVPSQHCRRGEQAVSWSQTGPQGAQGIQGVQGNPGLVWRGTWGAGTTYKADDAVSSGGSAYKALSETSNDPPPSENWLLL